MFKSSKTNTRTAFNVKISYCHLPWCSGWLNLRLLIPLSLSRRLFCNQITLQKKRKKLNRFTQKSFKKGRNTWARDPKERKSSMKHAQNNAILRQTLKKKKEQKMCLSITISHGKCSWNFKRKWPLSWRKIKVTTSNISNFPILISPYHLIFLLHFTILQSETSLGIKYSVLG